MESNVIEFMEAANKNHYDSINQGETYRSNIIALQGMCVEMFSTQKNFSDLMANLHLAKEIYSHEIDYENTPNVVALANHKENQFKQEEAQMKLAA